MLGETLGGDEALPALLALVRFIVIYLLMVLEVANAREAGSAVAALEEAALGVSQQMFFQAAGLLESLTALLTVIAATSLRAVVSEFVQ